MTSPELRNRFDFGATASWNTETPRTNPSGADRPGSQAFLPGAYIPDDAVDDTPVDDIPMPDAPIPDTPSRNGTQQNPDKTCRICLSGVEDGTNSQIHR